MTDDSTTADDEEETITIDEFLEKLDAMIVDDSSDDE